MSEIPLVLKMKERKESLNKDEKRRFVKKQNMKISLILTLLHNNNFALAKSLRQSSKDTTPKNKKIRLMDDTNMLHSSHIRQLGRFGGSEPIEFINRDFLAQGDHNETDNNGTIILHNIEAPKQLDPSSSQNSTCVNHPLNWYDSDGELFDCEWYESKNCPDFEDFYKNFNATAQEACCACGGGRSTTRYKLILNETCEHYGLVNIYDPDECSEAASDYEFDITWGPWGGFDTVTDGCSIESRSKLYVNSHGWCDPTKSDCVCTDSRPCFCGPKPPPPPTKYKLVKSGTCTSSGHTNIRTLDECSNAAQELGLDIQWGPYSAYHDNMVDGCSVRFGSDLFLNPSGSCDAKKNTHEWTDTGCECSSYQPCLCGPLSPTSCDWEEPFVPDFPDDLVLRSEWTGNGTDDTYDYITSSIFAIWWDSQFDHRHHANWIAAKINDARCRSIVELGMKDPPNVDQGVYYNIYVHHARGDSFLDRWGNGQGTNNYDLPFLTLPYGAHLLEYNVNHEAFHVFQYSSNSPGYEYEGDSKWYIEASSQWYNAYRRPGADDTFIQAGLIYANPHLAMWHSFDNGKPDDHHGWMYHGRQYGMHSWLFYMTEVAGYSRDTIVNGFYRNITMTPQEYHYRTIGPDEIRHTFADWAAHNAGGFDYLTNDQIDMANDEVNKGIRPDNYQPYIANYTNSGTCVKERFTVFKTNPSACKGNKGARVAPPPKLLPRGWSYNVIQIFNNQPATYSFQIRGDKFGSDGVTKSNFQCRIVIIGPNGSRYQKLEMSDDGLRGSGNVTVRSIDTKLFFVVVSTPEHFGGYQTYGYSYGIDRSDDKYGLGS